MGLWKIPEEAGGASGTLEAYAFAYAEAKGLPNHFAYTISKLDDIISEDKVSDDVNGYVESEDATPSYAARYYGADITPEVQPEPYTLLDYYIERWVGLLRWMSNISEEALRMHTVAKDYEARAAEDKIDLAAIVGSQKESFPASYNKALHISRSVPSTTLRCYRDTTIDYTIYSAHSFTNKLDYYLVQCDITTTPHNCYDIEVAIDFGDYPSNWLFNYVVGQTKYMEIEHHIDDGTMGTDEVNLQKSIPPNINHEKQVTKTESCTLGGTLGFNGLGGTGGFNASVTHTLSQSYGEKEYEISKLGDPNYKATTKWSLTMNDPQDRDSHHSYYEDGGETGYYAGVNTGNIPSSIKPLEMHPQWFWEVGQNYWLNHQNPVMNVSFRVDDGLVHGKSSQYRNYGAKTVSYKREDKVRKHTFKKAIALWKPPHVIAYVEDPQTKKTSQYFTPVDYKGTDTDINFFFFCNTDWTVESDSDWCHITSATSGSDTGDHSRSILVRVDEYPFVGESIKAREAVITVRETRSNGDKSTVIVQQSAPHILVNKTQLNAKIFGGEMSFNLFSDSDWTVESDSDWCKIKSTSSAGGKAVDKAETITFTVASAWGLEKFDKFPLLLIDKGENKK